MNSAKKRGAGREARHLTIGQARGWAIARLGLDRESFGLLRLGEFWEALTVWIEDRNAERRHEAEVIRGVGLRLFNLQLAKEKSLKPHEFMPFPWDEEENDPGALENLTEDEKKASLDKLLGQVKW